MNLNISEQVVGATSVKPRHLTDDSGVWPSFSEEEIQAVVSVLESGKVNYWTGNECRAFEQEYSAHFNIARSIAVMNGTVALDAAMLALGIGTGDEVIVTSRTFIASISSIINAGATPVFADVDRDSQNITVQSIEQVLTPRTKAVLCVHLAGWPCDMIGIRDLAQAQDLRIIEDCAQAHGARLQGHSVGQFSDVAAWSFCQDKIMTTGGEGGMITTDNEELWSRMWSAKDHGKSWDAIQTPSTPGQFKWVHESFGTNWRMLEAQAAIGRVQLRRLDAWTDRRLEHAEKIWSTAGTISALRVPVIPEDVKHAAYKCYVFVEPDRLAANWNRDRIVAELNDNGIKAAVGSCSEVYLEKAFEGTGLRPKHRLPIARELAETSIMFQVHPTLSLEVIDHLCETLRSVMDQAGQ